MFCKYIFYLRVLAFKFILFGLFLCKLFRLFYNSSDMKQFGSSCEFAVLREADLLRAYFSCLGVCAFIKMPDIFRRVVNLPSSRFWVSETRASVVIAAIERGDQLEKMRSNKREMFFEIYRRYQLLRSQFPTTPTSHLVGRVIEQAAPKFYLSPSSAKIIILKARKKWFRANSKNP